MRHPLRILFALLVLLFGGTASRAEEAYQESLRPQFHYTTRSGWSQDPCGLSFYLGEYHLFYDHNPHGTVPGSGGMSWGHAVSTDLVHWRELGDALWPDALGGIHSGSAVVDTRNTSGFGTPGHPAQVLVYSAGNASYGQCLAWSTDGRAYTRYSGNPVVPQISYGNRDPKVFWYAPGKEWIMCLYVGPYKAVPDAVGRPAVTRDNTVRFLASTDLKRWQMRGSISGFFECPNLFQLPLDGDPSHPLWILTDASSDYRVGRFDGWNFIPATAKLRGHSGEHVNFYAAQVFGNLPTSDHRVIQIGWLPAKAPGMPFNQAMSLPMSLGLITTPNGPRMTWEPVRELRMLRYDSMRLAPIRIGPGAPNPFARFTGDGLEVRAEFRGQKSARVVLNVRGVPIAYDADSGRLIVNGHAATAPPHDGWEDLAVYLDRTSLEVYASGGLVYVPVPIIADAKNRSLAVSVEGGEEEFRVLEAHHLRSIWSR